MLRRSVPLVLCLALACAAHEKSGDRAAAVGDWKTAERAYAEAVRKDPEKKDLQEKYRQAKAAALADATRKAQACAAAADWECALAESDYAVQLDPGSAAMATLRRDAAREAGHLRLRLAKEAASRRELAHALKLVESARLVTDDPGVAQESRRVAPPIVRAAQDEADALRAQTRFPEAIDLLALAARVDAGVAPRLQAMRAEYERWKDAEAERFAAEGDALVRHRRWAEAKASYDRALSLRPQCRAVPLARYAGLLASGEAAIGRRDFAGAERLFAEAAQMNVDRGVALEELDRVRIRPYAIRLRSVLVRPTRPDGYPWAGSRGRDLDRVIARLASFGGASSRVGLAIDLARRIPHENQPTLVVTVALPDGRGLQTRPRRGVYSALDGSFVVASNAYDDRSISLRVVHEDRGNAMDVGMVSFKVADLVSAGELSVADASVSELRLEADPADLPDGAYAGFLPIPDDGNVAQAWSSPTRATRGYRIAGVEAAAVLGDYVDEGPGEGAPDLYVEIEQRGQVVYRSPTAADRASASFRPRAAYLFAEPQESILVRLVDQDPNGNDIVLAQAVTGSLLESGVVDLATPRRSTVRVRLEPRHAGP